MAKRTTRTKNCQKCEGYIEDAETLCEFHLLEKLGLGLARVSFDIDSMCGYYSEEDVVKALRKASGL